MNMIEKLESEFKVIFPNGYFHGVDISTSSRVRIGLISDLQDCSFSIRRNDPMLIHYILKEKELKIEFETRPGIYCNPTPGSYMAMEFCKLPHRTIKGKSEIDLINKFIIHLCKLKQLVITERDANNIYGQNEISPKYLDL